MLLTHKMLAFYYKSIYEFSYENILISPPYNGHIILFYENESDLYNSLATYINEGLKRGQICGHASVNLNNKDYIQNFSSRITNYHENLEEGNLVIIDLAIYNVQVMVGNLGPLKNLKKEIMNIANKDNNRWDKHIRLTADCAT